MEVVFITIHDLSPDARIKYCSSSVEYILGYRPDEVKGKSCWEYFHPDELPFAKAIHGRGLDLQKTAALNYCRIKHKDGSWVNCECAFTVVYDVLVASTAIYQCGPRSQKRAVEGAAVRRIFSSTPRDPRYHMLTFMSDKFQQPWAPHAREPRAALILNRFSRTCTIMFATSGVEQILGFSPSQLVGKSFYYCIAENCLSQAVRTVESAKGNDSIAYLRFSFRDPTLPDPPEIEHGDSDSDEESDGGVQLNSSRNSTRSSVDMASPPPRQAEEVPAISARSPPQDVGGTVGARATPDGNLADESEVDGFQSRTSSGNSAADHDRSGRGAVFDEAVNRTQSSESSVTPRETPPPAVIEIEAFVSCSSDGLVVVLRRAQNAAAQQPYPNGLFASPWAEEPILPHTLQQNTSTPTLPPASDTSDSSGFMSAIRDVAAFAWSLTGINGALIDQAGGTPGGEALPPDGLPVWDPTAPSGQNDRHNGYSAGVNRPIGRMDDPTGTDVRDVASSDEEIVWRRVPQMPAFRRPKRRAHTDAFGDEAEDSTDTGGVQVPDSRRRKLGDGKGQSSTPKKH